MTHGAPLSPSFGEDTRIDWRIVLGCALALTALFSLQNHLAPNIQPENQTWGRAVAVQLSIWVVWLALLPLVFRIAKNARRHASIGPRLVATQLIASALVVLLHNSLAGTMRWLVGAALSDDLGTVIVSSMTVGFAGNMVRFWLISAAYHAVTFHRELKERASRGESPLTDSGAAPEQQSARIAVPSSSGIMFLRLQEIDWVGAAGDQVQLHAGADTHSIRETMTQLERRLPVSSFMRIHRSTIVNVERVREIQPWFKGDYVLILRDGTKLTSGRTYRDRIQRLLK